MPLYRVSKPGLTHQRTGLITFRVVMPTLLLFQPFQHREHVRGGVEFPATASSDLEQAHLTHTPILKADYWTILRMAIEPHHLRPLALRSTERLVSLRLI